MINDLKFYWLEKITYTRVLTEPDFNAETLPPVIAPALTAEQVLNILRHRRKAFICLRGKPMVSE